MKYMVREPFQDLDGAVRRRGDIVKADDARAAKLLSLNLIERATAPPAERTTTRTHKPRKKKVEDEAPTDSAPGD